ncbi:MAG TPA: hypothetical protein VG797_01095 [Phycisphaerales bacterium]|nr:hypothetical protein [Phycisphaerales bacterium]
MQSSKDRVEMDLIGAALALAMMLGLSGEADAQLVRSGAGDAATVTGALNQYRADLGALNPNQPGSFGTGRREINWDGVPDAQSDANLFPGNFFNGPAVGRARGAEFSTPGTGLLTSADSDNPTNTLRDFGSIDPSYVGEFEAFSPQRLFTSVGSNVTDVTFFVPGTSQPALTRGFGSVFSDVELADTTAIEFYDANNALLTTAYAPVVSDRGTSPAVFSFVGVSYADPIVARVRIYSGNAALGAGVLDRPFLAEFPTDLVVMDDFVYGEPVAVPAPGVSALAAIGFGAMSGRRRRGS